MGSLLIWKPLYESSNWGGFADDFKLIFYSNDIATLLEYHEQTFIWTDSWGMQHNVALYRYLHPNPALAPVLDMPNDPGKPFPYVEQFFFLRVDIDFSMKFSVHISKAVAKARKILHTPNRNFVRIIHTSLCSNRLLEIGIWCTGLITLPTKGHHQT